MPENKKDKDKIHPETPHLILCEGEDDFKFLIYFLEFFIRDDQAFDLFKVYNFGGIQRLNQYLRILIRQDGFKKVVKSLCIIRDADKSAASACQSIQTVLDKCGFAVPAGPYSWTSDSSLYPQISTGFVLFPDCNATPQPGTLEDLCLRILGQEGAEDILSHADTALAPYRNQLRRLHKNRLHTYFSLTDAFVSLKIGEAAKAQAFRYDAPEIASLKTFLSQIAGA